MLFYCTICSLLNSVCGLLLLTFHTTDLSANKPSTLQQETPQSMQLISPKTNRHAGNTWSDRFCVNEWDLSEVVTALGVYVRKYIPSVGVCKD